MIVLVSSYRESGLSGLIPVDVFVSQVEYPGEFVPNIMDWRDDFEEERPLITHIFNFRVQMHLLPGGALCVVCTGDMYSTKENLDVVRASAQPD